MYTEPLPIVPLRLLDIEKGYARKVKGTLMQIWKSADISFAFIRKYYAEDFILKHLLFVEICARVIREKFVQKQ